MLDQGLSAIASAAAQPLKSLKKARKALDPLLDVLTQDPSETLDVASQVIAEGCHLLGEELQRDAVTAIKMAATAAEEVAPSAIVVCGLLANQIF